MSTPTEHVATLVELATQYEEAAKQFTRNRISPEHGIAKLYHERAEAIRWILSETAHGVEPGELVV